MQQRRERELLGIESLNLVTALLRRVRIAHPVKGLMEAADYSWWWHLSRRTDATPQLFWFDNQGQVEAAVVATAWGAEVSLDVIVLPDSDPAWVEKVVERGFEHAASLGYGKVEVMLDGADEVLLGALLRQGLARVDDPAFPPDVEAWMPISARPPISELPASYCLHARCDVTHLPHHLDVRSGQGAERRLLQTPLYRPELDLVVLDSANVVAAFGLFWYDAETSTGLVEPMHTIEGYRKRGLARHVLTCGLDRLAEIGAERVKIVYRPDNAAAKHMYLSSGFEPAKETIVVGGQLRSR